MMIDIEVELTYENNTLPVFRIGIPYNYQVATLVDYGEQWCISPSERYYLTERTSWALSPAHQPNRTAFLSPGKCSVLALPGKSCTALNKIIVRLEH